MKSLIREMTKITKNIYFGCRPHLFLYWLQSMAFLFSNSLSLSKWMSKQDRKNIFNDFFQFKRQYQKRYLLYQYVVDTLQLQAEAVDYIEFGVYQGSSLKWWLRHLSNADCRFYGFDSFAGLPEQWGTYSKGDMHSDIPQIDDNRVSFIKGFFHLTVPKFLATYSSQKRKIIHLDADLFSSTLFVLTSMAGSLRTGDILIFDEFNVPNHEFLAFKLFTESYHIAPRLIGAVNNYYQVAFIIP